MAAKPKPTEIDDHKVGHRQRLKDRFMTAGRDGLADYELLELILFYAIPRKDVKPLAKTLIKRFDGLAGVLSADPDELTKAGLGPSAVTLIRLVRTGSLELSRQQVLNKPIINSWERLIDYIHGAMAYETNEQFRVLFLDKQHTLIIDEVISEGTVDQTAIYPRNIIKRALDLGAYAMVLVHNHPGGDPTPSKADIAMTKEMIKIAEMMGLKIHDHVIVGKQGHSSFKTMGLM